MVFGIGSKILGAILGDGNDDVEDVGDDVLDASKSPDDVIDADDYEWAINHTTDAHAREIIQNAPNAVSDPVNEKIGTQLGEDILKQIDSVVYPSDK